MRNRKLDDGDGGWSQDTCKVQGNWIFTPQNAVLDIDLMDA